MLNKNKKSIRLTGYDYSLPGYYFVTICTHEMGYFFGECADGVMKLNKFGEIVGNELLKTPQIRPGILLDAFAIMPNHIHAIIAITDDGKLPLFDKTIENIYPNVGSNCCSTEIDNRTNGSSSLRDIIPRMKPNSISSMVSGFKSVTTKQINILRDALGNPVWQTRFYDHIIRDEESFENIREYIKNNPANWDRDSKNHDNFNEELNNILKK